MQLDRETLAKMLALDDETFKKKIADAARAAGFESPQLAQIMKDVGSLKASLSNVSQTDLNRAATVIGTDKAEEIIKNLKKNL